MSDSPRDRSRRNKPSRASETGRTVEAGEENETVETKPSSRAKADGGDGRNGTSSLAPTRNSPVWPLVAGLAIGFAAGREAYRFGLPDGRSAAAPEGSSAISAESAKGAYAKMSEFPSGWLKDSDLGASGSVLAGLTDAQKVVVMQALNERNCECGCGMGSLAVCLQKDPNCPRSPAMAKLAVEQVKQGKGVKEIEAAIDAKQKEMGGQKPAAAPEPPAVPRRVELAAWNPRKGPKAAKVTVVEFSDFQ